MSVQHISQVWTDPDITDTRELLVMLALADYSRHDGKSWPSIDSIALKARCEARAVQRALSRLKKHGKINVEIGSGPHGTSVYTILSPKGGVKMTGGVSRTTPGVSNVQQEMTPNPLGTVSTKDIKREKSVNLRDSFSAPTLEEVTTAGQFRGLPPEECRNFFLHYEANGWQAGGSPIVKWQPKLQTWLINWKTGKGNSVRGRKLPTFDEVTLNGKTYRRRLSDGMLEDDITGHWFKPIKKVQPCSTETR